MTAALHARPAGPRLQAIVSIIRKDLRLFGWYAAACAVASFAASALVHVQADIPALVVDIGNARLQLDVVLYLLCAVAVPIALMIFVVIVVQADAAADTQRDWLVRPVAPLEIVAAKAALILATVAAPAIAGDLVYMAIKPMPAADVFAPLAPMLSGSIFLLVMSWLVSTSFRALMAIIGVCCLLAVIIALAFAIKFAVGFALAGEGARVDVTPFPGAGDTWIVMLGGIAGLLVVSAAVLWLLLARRRPIAARWLFGAYFAASMFLQFLLFIPLPAAAPEPVVSTEEAAMPRSS